jgi:hypothetical protein
MNENNKKEKYFLTTVTKCDKCDEQRTIINENSADDIPFSCFNCDENRLVVRSKPLKSAIKDEKFCEELQKLGFISAQ